MENGLYKLTELAKKEIKDLKKISFLLFAYGLVSIVSPLAVQSIVNFIAIGGSLQPIYIIAIIFFFMVTIKGVFIIFEKITVEYLQRRIFVDNASAAKDALIKLSLTQLKTKKIPDLINRFFDVIVVQKSVSSLLSVAVLTIFQGVAGCLILFFYSPYFLIIIFFVGLYFYFAVSVIGKKGYETAVDVSKVKYEFVSWLYQIFRNSNFTRLSAMSDAINVSTENIINAYLKKRDQHYIVLLKQNIFSYAFYAIISTAMLLMGGWLVTNGIINLGQFVAAEVIFFGAIVSFIRFISQLDSYYELTAALDKVSQLVDSSSDKESKKLIALDNINSLSINLNELMHVDDKRRVRENISLTKGDILLLSNSIGSSRVLSFAEIIAGEKSLNRNSKNILSVNNISFSDICLSSFRKRVLFLSRFDFFEASILDNLNFNNNYSDDFIQDLLLKLKITSSAEPTISLNTILERDGDPLSVSKKIKLLFLRALLLKPDLIVIDLLFDYLDEDDQKLLSRLFATFQKDFMLVIETTNKTVSIKPTYKIDL